MDELDHFASMRSAVLEPSAAVAERTHAAISDAIAREHARAARAPVRRQRSIYATAALIGVALATAAAVVLVAPWTHGPAAISSADAALILQRTTAAVTPHAGWILHEQTDWSKLVPGTNIKRHGTTELWVENKPPYNFRYLSDLPDLSTPLETGGSASTGRGYAYDPKTNTLYRQSVRGTVVAPGPQGAAGLRQVIAQETAAGKAKVTGRTRIDGHNVFEITIALSQPPIRLYVDTTTYAPVRIVWPGLRPIDGYWFSNAQSTVVYKYLPPTPANIRLANIENTHPAAAVAPSSKMPEAFRTQVNWPYHTTGR